MGAWRSEGVRWACAVGEKTYLLASFGGGVDCVGLQVCVFFVGGVSIVSPIERFLKGGARSLKGGAKSPEGGARTLNGGAKSPEGGARSLGGGAKSPEGGARFLNGGAKSPEGGR